MSQVASSSPSVCFLLGLPRSGTTLLAHLLQQHRDLLAPSEPWLMLALESFGQVDRGHPAAAHLISMATEEFLGRIDRIAAYRAMADAAYGQYLAAAGKRCFIDKTPRYWMATKTIDALYPSAAQIILLRNPFAIAASLKSSWGISLFPDSFVPEHGPYLADLVLGLPVLAARHDHPNTQVVHYEALVREPREELQRIIAALGYDPEGIASTTIENTEYLKSGGFGDRKILEKKSVDDHSIKVWLSELSLTEMQAVVDMVGADLFIALDYEEDLRHAYDAGVVDRGAAVTQRHRTVFTAWRSLVSGQDIGSLVAHDPLAAEDARRLAETETAEITKLRHALAISEADRAARLQVIQAQDATIAELTAERHTLLRSRWWRAGARLGLTPHKPHDSK